MPNVSVRDSRPRISIDRENRQISSYFHSSDTAGAFPGSKCLCLNFEVRDVRSIKTPVSKSFRPRGFFVRNPRHPAKTRDVTPVFSATYAHAAARAVSLPPTPPIEKDAVRANSGAQISGKSRPNQRHAGSGLYGAFPSRERFPASQMDRRVMRNGIF
jgi:hypothetical protein